MIRRLLFLLLLLLPGPAAAQPTLASTFLEGSWALKVEGATIMRFDLTLAGDQWTGAWTKPTSFRSDRDGKRFADLTLPAVERRADSGRAIGDWAEITFNDPRPGEEPDVFRFHLIATDRAELLYVGTGFAPFTLERVTASAQLGPFRQGEVYGDGVTARASLAPLPGIPPRASPTPTPTPTTPPPVQGPARPPAMTGR